MPKTIIESEGSVAIGPYSPGVGAEGLFFFSGKAALDEEGNVIARGDVRGQTEATLKAVEKVLLVYGNMLPKDRPARSTVLMVPARSGLAGRDRCHCRDWRMKGWVEQLSRWKTARKPSDRILRGASAAHWFTLRARPLWIGTETSSALGT